MMGLRGADIEHRHHQVSTAQPLASLFREGGEQDVLLILIAGIASMHRSSSSAPLFEPPLISNYPFGGQFLVLFCWDFSVILLLLQ
jgi:hypothetical protein